MKSIIFLFLISFVCFVQSKSLASDRPFEPLTDEHVDYINNLKTTWRAGHNFKGLKVEQLKRLLGVEIPIEENKVNSDAENKYNIGIMKLPDSFDSTKQWPDCADVINHVRDQGSCGSCWAVAAAGAITDRVCIASGGKNKTLLSAQEMTSCCTSCFNTEGCQGGFPLAAFRFWAKEGLPTGGDFNDKDTCAPYLVEPCEHHVEGKRPKCGDIVSTPKCTRKCTNNVPENRSFGKLIHQSNPWPAEIKTEIMKRGPVEAAFTVYDDFFLYKEGIYQVTENAKPLGGHAVVLYGWGTDNETKTQYWLAKNSWNTDWGNNGFFKIKMREAGIDSYVVSGIPK